MRKIIELLHIDHSADLQARQDTGFNLRILKSLSGKSQVQCGFCAIHWEGAGSPMPQCLIRTVRSSQPVRELISTINGLFCQRFQAVSEALKVQSANPDQKLVTVSSVLRAETIKLDQLLDSMVECEQISTDLQIAARQLNDMSQELIALQEPHQFIIYAPDDEFVRMCANRAGGKQIIIKRKYEVDRVTGAKVLKKINLRRIPVSQPTE